MLHGLVIAPLIFRLDDVGFTVPAGHSFRGLHELLTFVHRMVVYNCKLVPSHIETVLLGLPHEISRLWQHAILGRRHQLKHCGLD